jgi:hypothetical protein
MALFHNPQIATSGLVFAYDSANIKSYQGPPIQNKLTSISPMTASGTGYSFIGGSEYSDIPTIGPTLVQYSNIQNNYSAVSTWCCPNPFSYGNDISVSGSTLYTYAIVYRVESGYTNGNYMYRYEYNGGTYVTETGVHSDSNRIHLGNGWYWAWGTFTTQASTTRLLGLASFYYRYSTAYDKLSVAKALLVQGDYSALHPRYWPDVNTTRATTAAILDLTNNTTLTASNLTYANNGTLSFNGSSGNITSSSFTRHQTTVGTLMGWAYPTSTSGDLYFVAAGGTTTYGASRAIRINSGAWCSVNYGSSTEDWNGIVNANLNTWQHVAYVWSGTTIRFYLNGVEYTNTRSGMVTPLGSVLIIGATSWSPVYGYWPGSIGIIQVYNRALSATEVQQNFNAQRTRYGI